MKTLNTISEFSAINSVQYQLAKLYTSITKKYQIFRHRWRPYSKTKLELNSPKVELEGCKNLFICVYLSMFCT